MERAATYLGGGAGEEGRGIAVDGVGNAYVTGATFSADFPTSVGAFDTTLGGSEDAFVTKLGPSGSAPLLYSTYLGGGGNDAGLGIMVDGAGNAYVTGRTVSTDFPTTAGAFDTTFGGNRDAFAQCKNDGWKTFNTPRTFKNQGDCIQFVNTGK